MLNGIFFDTCPGPMQNLGFTLCVFDRERDRGERKREREIKGVGRYTIKTNILRGKQRKKS